MKVRNAGVVLALIAAAACGGGDAGGNDTGGGDAQAAVSELTAAQLENGIGPVTSLTLPEEIDADMAAEGQEVFAAKCYACHRLEVRYTAPQLGGVLERRTPAFVMNMILNPEEMTKRHPETKKLLAEFMLAMPNQTVTQEEARAVLEYIRSWQE